MIKYFLFISVLFIYSNHTYANQLEEHVNKLDTRITQLESKFSTQPITVTEMVDLECLRNVAQHGLHFSYTENWLSLCRTGLPNKENCKLTSSSANNACYNEATNFLNYDQKIAHQNTIVELCRNKVWLCRF